MDILAKLEEFKKEDDLDEVSITTLQSWERQLEEIRVSESFLEHPETTKLREIASTEIKNIESRLKFEEDMSEIERKGLFREKRAHLVYLGFVTRDVESLEKALEDEITFAEEQRG